MELSRCQYSQNYQSHNLKNEAKFGKIWLMNFKEFWTGTKEEQMARADFVRLEHKKRRMGLTAKETEILGTRRTVTRRWLVRRMGVATVSVAVATGTPLAYFALQEINREEEDIDTYKRYRDGLISIGAGDEEVGELLNLAAERSRLGRMEGLAFVIPHGFDKKHDLLVAVISPQRDRANFISAYRIVDAEMSKDNTVRLEILKIPITPLWAGALLAHELVWVRSHLESPKNWFEIELNGFELEFRLLDRGTRGKFNEVVLEIAKGEEDWILELSRDQVKIIDSVFAPSESKVEANQREQAFLFAVNFAIARTRAVSLGEDEKLLKIDYLKTRFDPEYFLPIPPILLARE